MGLGVRIGVRVRVSGRGRGRDRGRGMSIGLGVGVGVRVGSRDQLVSRIVTQPVGQLWAGGRGRPEEGVAQPGVRVRVRVRVREVWLSLGLELG